MKKLISILICGVMLVVLAACGAEQQPPETEITSPKEEVVDENVGHTSKVRFSTTDREGKEWTEKSLEGKKLTMINFWAPWCGPCVGEMPDLNKLYENYKDDGLLILGIYGVDNSSTDEEVAATIKDTGVTYPNLRYCPEFSALMTDYFPTTVFIDENGKILGEPVIGARSYDEWVEIIEEIL